MNDFTKTELQYIRGCIGTCFIAELLPAGLLKTLRTKIQSLIDNFCEQHESDGYDYFKIAEDEALIEVLEKRNMQFKCKNCGILYYE